MIGKRLRISSIDSRSDYEYEHTTIKKSDPFINFVPECSSHLNQLATFNKNEIITPPHDLLEKSKEPFNMLTWAFSENESTIVDVVDSPDYIRFLQHECITRRKSKRIRWKSKKRKTF
jgi:hypothetical protein